MSRPIPQPPLPRPRRARVGLVATTAAVSAVVVAGVVPPAAGAGPAPTATAGDPQRVIIELVGDAVVQRVGAPEIRMLRHAGPSTARAGAAAREYDAAVDAVVADQSAVLGRADSDGLDVEPVRSLSTALNAVIAEVDPADLDELRALPGVARVTVDSRVRALEAGSSPSRVPRASGPDGEPEHAAAPPADDGPDDGPDDGARPAGEPALGAGVTVAVLDTGVDYSLTDLGGGFGEGYKVVDGYDFVHDDTDPMDDHYHGTHVAGIVAGTGAESVRGVAPDATLTAYKVLDDAGVGYTSWILAGIDAAADPLGEHPADVINLSLGGDGDGTDPISEAAGNAVHSGVLVVAAAGNAGPAEATIGSPAIARDVLAVGASVTDYREATATLVAPFERDLVDWRLPFSAVAPDRTITAPIVDVGEGTEEDFDRAGDVTGMVVAWSGPAPRGTDGDIAGALPTARRAEERGAVAAIVHAPNPLAAPVPAPGGDPAAARAAEAHDGVTEVLPSPSGALDSGDDMRMDSLVSFGMSASEYAVIAGAVRDGTARLTISSVDATDTIASFSSRGPTPAGVVKPEIVAPGFEIRSTVPAWHGIEGNAYHLSGTSMATPHVAGAAAVLLAQRPELDPLQARATLVGSAAPLAGASERLSPALQGAGRADSDAAVASSVVASPDTIGFGQADADGAPAVAGLTLTNASTVPLTTTLEVVPSATSHGTLELDRVEVALEPGGSVTVTATAAAELRPEDSELSGVIVATSSDGTRTRVPYQQLNRHLEVRTTPEPSDGSARVMVSSFVPVDEPPVLAVTDPRGRTTTLRTTASSTMPGWFSADVSDARVGVHTVTARASTEGNAVLGRASIEVLGTAKGKDPWQQVGRDASSAFLEPSVRPGTAMQLTSTSARPFVTQDFGRTWTQVRSLPVADGSGQLVADPEKGRAYWYAINGAVTQPPQDPSYQGRLLRTEDLGRTWSVLPMPDVRVHELLASGRSLVAVVDGGVEVSPDGGLTWRTLPYTWGDGVTGATLHDGDLYVTGFATAWRVPDVLGRAGTPVVAYAGGGWPAITGVASTGDALVLSLGDGVLRSADGVTWTRGDLETWYTNALTAIGSELFVGELDGYSRSTDGGATWTQHANPVPGSVPTDFDRWPGDTESLLLPLENAGLYASQDDGATFARIGVSATSVVDVLATHDGDGQPVVRVADDQGTGARHGLEQPRLGADVTEWGPTGGEARVGGAAREIERDADDPDRLWRVVTDAYFQARLQESVDGGGTWDPVGPAQLGVSFRDLTASPTVPGHVVAAYSTRDDAGVLVTRDGWETWEAYSHPLAMSGVTIDPHDDSRLWIAAADGLYRSDDDGHTVVKVLDGELRTVLVSPDDADHVVAAGRGVWVSRDGGSTFEAADTAGADVYVSSLDAATVAVPGGGGAGNGKGKGKGKGEGMGNGTEEQQVLFAGSTTYRPGPFTVTGRGVLASLDGGLTWVNVSSGLDAPAVASLDASDDGRWLFAGTLEGGLFRSSVADLVKVAR